MTSTKHRMLLEKGLRYDHDRQRYYIHIWGEAQIQEEELMWSEEKIMRDFCFKLDDLMEHFSTTIADIKKRLKEKTRR